MPARKKTGSRATKKSSRGSRVKKAVRKVVRKRTARTAKKRK